MMEPRATPLTGVAHAWDCWPVLADWWTDPIEPAFVADPENCVMLAPGVSAPSRYVAHANIEDSWEVRIDVTVNVLGPFARELTVVPRDRLLSIGSEVLRKIPVATILSQTLENVIFIRFPDGRILWGNSPVFMVMPAELRGEWPGGDRLDEVLDWVALVYRVANALGKGPTAQVAKAAAVSRATAGRMVAACRERGLLSESETPQLDPRFEMRTVTMEDINFLRGSGE